MNTRALLVALLVSICGLVLMQVYMHRFEVEVSGGDPVPVLFVRRDVAPGSVITPDMLAVRMVPQAYVDQRHITAQDQADVVGTQVGTGVKVNDALLWTDLAVMRDGRSLSDLVQPGMRAVSINTTGLNGLVRPGDRVDVLFVASKGSLMEGTESSATTLVQNALVLAVGKATSRSAEIRSGGNLTLSLSVEQAQLLAVSRKDGSLQVVLRNPEDVGQLNLKSSVTSDDLRDPKRRRRFLRAHEVASMEAEEEESHAL